MAITNHEIKPTGTYQVTVIMTNHNNVRVTKNYANAADAARHYAEYSTLNWEYGCKAKDPSYSFDFDRYHAYQDRLYRRVLKYFRAFMR